MQSSAAAPVSTSSTMSCQARVVVVLVRPVHANDAVRCTNVEHDRVRLLAMWAVLAVPADHRELAWWTHVTHSVLGIGRPAGRTCGARGASAGDPAPCAVEDAGVGAGSAAVCNHGTRRRVDARLRSERTLLANAALTCLPIGTRHARRPRGVRHQPGRARRAAHVIRGVQPSTAAFNGRHLD